MNVVDRDTKNPSFGPIVCVSLFKRGLHSVLDIIWRGMMSSNGRDLLNILAYFKEMPKRITPQQISFNFVYHSSKEDAK